MDRVSPNTGGRFARPEMGPRSARLRRCLGKLDKGGYTYAFTDFDKLDMLIREFKVVGFAVPLEGDDFCYALEFAGRDWCALGDVGRRAEAFKPRATKHQGQTPLKAVVDMPCASCPKSSTRRMRD